MFKSKTKKNKGANASIPRSVQQTIQYVAAYVNGIIQVTPGFFSKTYSLSDINFRTADTVDQESLFDKFCSFLNTVSDADIELTCLNRSVDVEEFKAKHFIKCKNDGLDAYRLEINKILLHNLENGTSIISDKYLTLTIEANNIDLATQRFAGLDATVINGIREIGGSVATPLDIKSRLKLLRDSMQPGCADDFFCDLASLKASGASTKDIIVPSSMKITNNHMMLDDEYACSLFIANYPSSLTTDFIADINETPCNLVVSTHMTGVAQEKSIKMVRNQLVNINSDVIAQQKKSAQRSGGIGIISPDLEAAKEEAEELLHSLTKRNQKMFYVTFVVTVFAKTKEDLEQNIKMIQTVGQRHMCTIKRLNYQQECGLNASLPVGGNSLQIKRLLITESAALFIPYSSENLSQEGGLYYGLNAVSRNMILFNRLKSKNANGVILGTPGSGKSFSAKREIFSVLLGTNDDVYIVDPEGEYTPLAQLLGGEVVRIAAGSDTYINPLDMDTKYADDDDPVTLKADFLCSICETAIGGRFGLSPVQKSIIDRCVRLVYQPYLEHMAKHPELTSDIANSPTLVDFYETLLAQPEPEAQAVALALELYCTGSFDAFARKTTVNTKSRFVVYDIKDVGANLKELGLQVCLNDIWNRTIANKAKGKKTRFYLDEFYLLTQTESSARFLQQIFKRARKWGGVPTGITQNVEDLLASQQARSILNNCDFVMMLNQSPLDREQLSDMFHISPSLQTYITNANPGHGLLYTGRTIVPFTDEYPRDTESFRVMTTNPNDLKITDANAKEALR